MFRSISWQLQFSYGVLVLLALVGLGMFGFLHRKSEMLRQVDEGLQNRSKQISAILVRYDLGELRLPELVRNSKSPPPLPPPRGISEDAVLDETTYYHVWKLDDGGLNPAFASEGFPGVIGSVPHPRDLQSTGEVRTGDEQRQLLNRAVRNYVVLAGTDLSERETALNRFLVRLVLGELVFLVLFLIAGYWLTRRALRPIGRISKTARTISDGALDERIPEEGGSSELNDLSAVLNDSFDHLEASILRQRKFTSDASHELRTPIAAILAEGQSRPETIEEYRASLDRCVDTARSMGQLVDQLLELARYDSRKQEIVREPTDLDLLVNRAIQLVRPMAEEKAIGIEKHLDVVQANVNPVRISQVVLNLLNNAVSYTGEGGTIVVRLQETETGIEISVEDSGIGILKEDQPKIFDRFYRADASRSDHEKKHYGLGLAISREIALAHGGELRVESEEGKGSVFTLQLPREAG